MKKIATLLLCLLAASFAAKAQTYTINAYRAGIVQGATAESVNNGRGRNRNTAFSEITYSRKTPVNAVVLIDEQSGYVTLAGPQTKTYKMDFTQGGSWTNAGRKRRFKTDYGKDVENDQDILLERMVGGDGKLIQVSVFSGLNVRTYYVTGEVKAQ